MSLDTNISPYFILPPQSENSTKMAEQVKLDKLKASNVTAANSVKKVKEHYSQTTVETEGKAIQTVEMSHFENFSTMVNLSEGQSTFLSTLIAKMAETGLEDLVEWKKP